MDGHEIRSGLLIRSGHLSRLSPPDLQTLQDLVDVVIDLRTDSERRENPDVVMEGVAIRLKNFKNEMHNRKPNFKFRFWTG